VFAVVLSTQHVHCRAKYENAYQVRLRQVASIGLRSFRIISCSSEGSADKVIGFFWIRTAAIFASMERCLCSIFGCLFLEWMFVVKLGSDPKIQMYQ
jgi:hypothetical protein